MSQATDARLASDLLELAANAAAEARLDRAGTLRYLAAAYDLRAAELAEDVPPRKVVKLTPANVAELVDGPHSCVHGYGEATCPGLDARPGLHPDYR